MPVQCVCTLGLLIFLGGVPQEASKSASSDKASAHLSFVCNTGYSQATCNAQVARLRASLAKFDVEALGEWTWVLVRSEDWGPILRNVGRDPDSPAFTILEQRRTFLEEVLFQPSAARSRRLLEKWRVPLDQFLEFALAHELGHALCRERDEKRVYGYAAQLSRSGRVTC